MYMGSKIKHLYYNQTVCGQIIHHGLHPIIFIKQLHESHNNLLIDELFGTLYKYILFAYIIYSYTLRLELYSFVYGFTFSS